MNNRTLLIIAGLALPVIALAIVVSSSPHPGEASKGAFSAAPSAMPSTTPAAGGDKQKKRHWPTLEEARTKTEARLKYVESLSDSDWSKELEHSPHAAKTRQAAIEHNRQLLDKLNKMTPEQWDDEQRKKFQRRHKHKKRASASND